MTRKILSLLLALMMLLGVPCAQAETASETSESFTQFYQVPETLTYQGGLILRGYLKGADTTSVPLELAYVLTTSPYIILGQSTTWDVTISGGTGDYVCMVLLAHQDLDLDPFLGQWETADYFQLDGDSFDYTFTDPGRYFWEFRVMDDDGQFFSFQTRIYEAYEESDETDETTVVGKVNSIVAEYITPEMSDYARAKVLHDWIIYNAEYDYTFTHYDASGVLLYGTGVCDSYARAYLMLCTAAGLECMYISGTANNGVAIENHGWNMVKLGGSWYHVDCTWDDPGNGGECHTYFCVDDETMALDHFWNQPDNVFDSEGYLPPDAEGGDYEDEETEAAASYHFTFSTVEEYSEGIDRLVAAGQFYGTIYGKYTGSESISNFFYNYYAPWYTEKVSELSDAGLLAPNSPVSIGFENGMFTFTLPWKDMTEYVHIDETSLRLYIGEDALIFPTSYYPQSNAFTWTSSDPSVATVSASYSSSTGLVATITGVGAGNATITVTSSDGQTDSVAVTVLPPFEPDFSLNTATTDTGATLSWAAIPGVTEYRIYRCYQGQTTLLATTTATRYAATQAELPSTVVQELYIVGVRVVGGEEVLSYQSEPITYGRLTLSYASSLPASLLVIDDEAFAGNTGLTSLKLPSKLTTIGKSAFKGCTNLTTIRIPASVSSIGEGAFDGCPLQYAEVSQGSYAEEWLLEHFPNITLVY